MADVWDEGTAMKVCIYIFTVTISILKERDRMVDKPRAMSVVKKFPIGKFRLEILNYLYHFFGATREIFFFLSPLVRLAKNYNDRPNVQRENG